MSRRRPTDHAGTIHSRLFAALATVVIIATGGSALGAADTRGRSVDDAFQQATQAIESDRNLAPTTKTAMRDLLAALQAERQRDAAVNQTRQSTERQEIVDAIDEYMATHDVGGGDGQLLDGRLKIGGDIRLRQESTIERDSREPRHRQRVRARLAAKLQANDEIELGGRIVTGDADEAVSTNTTFGDGFNSLEISLDRIYVTWAPEAVPGLEITAGKFAHPFYTNPVYGGLVWDGDAQPEGLAVGLNNEEAGIFGNLTVVGGVFNMLEQNSGNDAYIFVAQAHSKLQPADNVTLDLAFGVHHYTDPTPSHTLAIIGENAGNATMDLTGDGVADEFVSDFTILNPIVAVHLPGPTAELPIIVSGEYIYNVGAQNELGSGYAAGVKIGKLQAPGSWQAYYQWQTVEQDAVFTPYAGDDFNLGSSNLHGHIVGWKTKVNDFTELHLWALVAQRDKTGTSARTDSDDFEYRLRGDLSFKF